MKTVHVVNRESPGVLSGKSLTDEVREVIQGFFIGWVGMPYKESRSDT